MGTAFPLSDDRLSRVCAASLVGGCAVGAVLALVIHLTEAPWPDSTTNPVNLVARGLSTPAGLLLVIGLPLLAVRFGRQSPWLAGAGLVTTMITIVVYHVFKGLFSAAVTPYLVAKGVEVWQDMSKLDPGHVSQAQPVGLLILFLLAGFAQLFGGILLGVAALRSHAVSRLAAGLMIGSSVLFLGAFGPPDGPLGEWPDLASTLALMAGLGLSGLELLGFQGKPAEAVVRARIEART
jgi:hypothetical protein